MAYKRYKVFDKKGYIVIITTDKNIAMLYQKMVDNS